MHFRVFCLPTMHAGGFNDAEKRALVNTSKINNELYLPWSDAEDRAERFTDGMYVGILRVVMCTHKKGCMYTQSVGVSETHIDGIN